MEIDELKVNITRFVSNMSVDVKRLQTTLDRIIGGLSTIDTSDCYTDMVSISRAVVVLREVKTNVERLQQNVKAEISYIQSGLTSARGELEA